MQDVTFKGITGRKAVTSVTIDGVRLRKGVPTQVSEKLANEIEKGSERLKGMRFEAETKTEETS
jgi:hypothetical protein